MWLSLFLFKPQFRQPLNNLYTLHAHIDDAQQQIKNIAGISNLFSPVVGVVGDVALFVGGELVALHDPFDGAVVDDSLFLPFFGEAHFFDGEVANFDACEGGTVS